MKETVMDWFEQLIKAKANGREYALNGIAAGETSRQESPLSGEWAGAPTPRDIVEAVAGPGAFEKAQDWEVTDFCDAWEDGYNSVAWPDEDDDGPARDSDLISPVIGDDGEEVIPAPESYRWSFPGGFAPGDEVDILVGGAWVGPYTVTDGEGRSREHLVLRGRSGVFEHHNDAPHNTRRSAS